MAEGNIQTGIMKRAETRFEQRLDHEIQYLLSKE
jgi:hypothetical protein